MEADLASKSIRVGARACANEGELVSLAYLWRETPIQAPVILFIFPSQSHNIALLQSATGVCQTQVWGAPIYGDNLHRLPAPPTFWEDIAAL